MELRLNGGRTWLLPRLLVKIRTPSLPLKITSRTPAWGNLDYMGAGTLEAS